MKNILMGMVFAVVALSATNAWAVPASQTVTVSATVPTLASGLSVTVSKVVGTVFSSASAISFGTLELDPVNNIYAPADKSYYALDIGVQDNSGTVWTVTHTRNSLANGTNNLNDKVNVTFNKQTSGSAASELQKVSFADSNSVAYTKTALAGGWLRIYYGLGTGTGDATGVTPIGLDTPAGTYTGSVTITLTP